MSKGKEERLWSKIKSDTSENHEEGKNTVSPLYSADNREYVTGEKLHLMPQASNV